MPFPKCESPAGTEEGTGECTRYKFLLPFPEQPIVLDTIFLRPSFRCQFWLSERKKIKYPDNLHQVFSVGMPMYYPVARLGPWVAPEFETLGSFFQFLFCWPPLNSSTQHSRTEGTGSWPEPHFTVPSAFRNLTPWSPAVCLFY